MRARLILVFSFLVLLPVQSLSAPIGTKHFDDPKPAPGFVLTDLKSDTHKLTDYRGKVLIVSFWATWCTPCIKELPSLARTADLLHGDDVRVVAINVGESSKDIKRFLARSPSDLVFLLDEQSKVSTAWDVRALPTAYVVDKQGRIAMRVIGGLEWDTDAMLRDLRNLAGQ
jgi:thiol-disulfide isomerase/thioredoxin